MSLYELFESRHLLWPSSSPISKYRYELMENAPKFLYYYTTTRYCVSKIKFNTDKKGKPLSPVHLLTLQLQIDDEVDFHELRRLWQLKKHRMMSVF